MKTGQINMLVVVIAVFLTVLVSVMWIIPAIKNSSGSIFDTGTDLVNDASSNLDNTWIYHEGDTPEYTDKVSDVTPITPAVGKCSDLPSKFWAGFSKYETPLKNAVASSNLPSVLSGTGYIPEAVVAAIFTYESGWNEKAVGPCGDGGIAQFQAGTASDMGLKWDYVEKYGRKYCSKFDTNCLGCSTCNPDYKSVCDLKNDPRMNAESAIPAAVKYIGLRLADCKAKVSGNAFVAVGISSYNTGNCQKVNIVYYKKILEKYYPMFAACLSENGYKPV